MTWFQALERTVSSIVAKSIFLQCPVVERAGVCTRIYLVRTSISRCATNKSENRLCRSSVMPTVETRAIKLPFSLQIPAQTLAGCFFFAAATTYHLCSWIEQRKSNGAHSTLAAEIRTYELQNHKYNGTSTPNKFISSFP